MNEKPALEILEVSLISDLVANPAEPKQYDRRDPEGRARMAWVLGLPIPHTPTAAHVRQPRAFTADTPSKASGTGRVYAHRSHRHYSNESEA